MQYYINGGRDERGVLLSEKSIALYKQLSIIRVLFIVYALVEDQWQDSWKTAKSLITIDGLETRSLTIHDSDIVAIQSAVQWADFVYMTGGSQKILLRRMNEFGTADILRQAIHQGNLKLLGGGSAGAMVMGSWCIVGRNSVKDILQGLDYIPGFVIDSHFNERNRLPRLQSVLDTLENKGLIGMGLDEDTAVLIDDTLKLSEIYGPGKVTIIENDVQIYDKNSTLTI